MTARSHLTQELLNYFDETDTRTRECPNTLEAQLLNSAALAFEESDARISREIDGRTLARVPANLDNRGVWYGVQLPPGLAIADSGPQTVRGSNDGTNWTSLKPYDDWLPVPSGVAVDATRAVVPFSSPTLFTLAGDGTPKTATAALAIPGVLHFWLEGMAESQDHVSVVVRGHKHPRVFWAGDDVAWTETLDLAEEGYYKTATTWAEIDTVEVNELPAGATLKAALFPFAFDYENDPSRPYIHPAYRDARFRRYWTIDDLLVKEVFFVSRYGGYETFQCYAPPRPVSGLAVEPNTRGMLLWDSTTLYYADRREPMPDKLDRTVLIKEPLYGIAVSLDPFRSGEVRFVNIAPFAFDGSAQMTQYRYLVETPDGDTKILTPEGRVLELSGAVGWRRGAPKGLSFPLIATGTYLFTLECIGAQGEITRDVFPFANADVAPLATLDLTGLIPEVQGVGFDSRQRLWAWTGSFLVPLKFRYDGYVWDADSRTVYLTDAYSKVEVL